MHYEYQTYFYVRLEGERTRVHVRKAKKTGNKPPWWKYTTERGSSILTHDRKIDRATLIRGLQQSCKAGRPVWAPRKD